MPPKLCCRTIVRDRSCVPFPQDCVHGPARRHGVYWQSIGHGFVLQWWCSSNDGHDLPPCIGATTTVRDRDCAPTPQVAVQAVKVLHALNSQSILHGCELHAGSFCSCGHALPPCAGCVVTRLVQGILNTPPPQVLEQLAATPRDRSEFNRSNLRGCSSVSIVGGHVQLPTAQSTGHRAKGESCTQGAVSLSAGHGAPLCCAAETIERMRSFTPSPHVPEHTPHAPQSDTEHGSGQGPS